MRRYRLLLAAAVVVLGLFGFVRPAAAAEDVGHAAHLCIELLEAGGTIDDCQEAPNPLLPETNEIIWGTVGFLVVVGFLYKFGYPAMKKTMDARTDRIRNDLDEAEQAKADAAQVLVEYRAQLSDARNEAGRIIEEARAQADALRREQETRLQTELAAMREQATADVNAAKTQAIADLRNEVTTLAIGAAEAVVRNNLDRQTQAQLVDEYINQVTASN